MIPTGMKHYVRVCLLACAIALLGNAVISAQSAGTLSGVVKDPSGAVMPAVAVTIRNVGTGQTRTAESDGLGRWVVNTLPVGLYQISYEAKDFQKLVQDGVTIEASVPRNIEAMLQIQAAAGQTVTVFENVKLAQTETAATFRQFSSQDLLELPTSTRSFTHLLSAEGGVSADLPPVLTNGNGNISPSVNGTRTTSTSLSFNGIDATNITSNEGALSNNIAPAPETLEEVKLQTSMYDASTGRSGGGNFQLITKSGTNDLHGTISWYVQNEKFNANDFFFNKDGIDRPKARRNEGGFTIGGPIKSDKLFFFGGYQRTQSITGFVPTASSQTTLPQALQLISGERTKANLLAAFSQLNPGISASIPKADCNSPTDRQCISDVALKIFNIQNPETGDYLIPAPRAGGASGGTDVVNGITGSVGGNPLIRQRNVEPARFTQDQFTTKLDFHVTPMNTLSGTFFFSNFPGYDPFPDPNSLASPITLKRDDRNRTLAISDTQIIGAKLTNEARFGYFTLNNTRVLDDPFLAITNDSIGVPNPAIAFDQGPGTMRLGHYVGRPGTAMERFSFGGPNDTFNRRKQTSFSFADTLSYIAGKHVLRFGAEFKRHGFDSALPEEQATEFEKYDNFTQLLRGVATEADTQFGITEKRFKMRDMSAFFADDYKISSKLSVNLGIRWEWFGWPEERDGRIGNFDPSLVTNSINPLAGFIIPSNASTTGFVAIDTAVAATARANTKHTLNGQDLNNFAPRLGFAYTPTEKLVIRGGYGIFYDRPSAAFINTIFSNYPYLREEEVTFPAFQVPLTTAWSQQDPNFPFNQYLPNRIVRTAGATGTYQIRDGTNVTLGADGSSNPVDPATGLPFVGNIAETFEFRAIDRNLRTPYVQQWNLGFQYELSKNLLVELRYVGTKGTKLLQATSFTQGYDLNDPSVPDSVFERFNAAYVAANSPNGPLNAGATAKERGVGKAFGFANSVLGGMIDYNLANSAGAVITFEGRARYLGFDVPEAILLGNSAFSNYHSGQVSVTKRFSRGLSLNAAYTYSKAMDNASADPGSTAGSGKPDLPNVGFTSQGDAFNTRANYAPADFDRTHRFSASYVFQIPTFGSQSNLIRGWSLSGFYQAQSGTPFTIFSPETTVGTPANYSDVRLGSAGLYRLAFGRPSLCGTIDELRQSASDKTEGYFNPSVLCSPLTLAGGYPDNRGFGNLGRNVLRGPHQQRLDVGLAKQINITETINTEIRMDVFNVLNNVNFALPSGVIGGDGRSAGAGGTDFGRITDTVGGPRVMQFGLRFQF